MKNDKAKLILAMVIFGTIGLVRRYIPYSSGLVALVRGVVGVIFLLAVHLIKKEKFPVRALRKNAALLCISGVLIGVNWIMLFEAYRFTSVSVATICYYMAPVLVILASPVLFHEALTPKKGLCALAAVIGMVLVSGVLESGLTGLKGVACGLCAAVMYAGVIVLNKKIDGISSGDRTFFQLAAASISLLPYVLLTENFSSLYAEPAAIGMLLVAGIVHTGFAYALYFGSLGSVPAQTAAILSYIDPVVAVLLSALVLKEEIDTAAIVGVALVLCSALFSEVSFKKAARMGQKMP